MTDGQWKRLRELIGELIQAPDDGEDDLCKVALAAAYMLPANRRIRGDLALGRVAAD